MTHETAQQRDPRNDQERLRVLCISKPVLYQLYTSFTSFEEFARRRGVGYHMPKMARATMATESDSPMRLNSTRRAKTNRKRDLPLSDGASMALQAWQRGSRASHYMAELEILLVALLAARPIWLPTPSAALFPGSLSRL